MSVESSIGNSDGSAASRLWPWTRLIVWFISIYQRAASGRPSPCRFVPSCSTYATEALRTHGTLKGGYLAIWRILRCNPWGGDGYDPVPPARHSHNNCDHASTDADHRYRTNSPTSRSNPRLHHHQKAH